MGRPGLWERILRAAPPARRRLLDRLVAEVENGTLHPIEALERYERETRVIPWRPFFAPIEATHRIFRAADLNAARGGARRVRSEPPG